MRSTKPIVFVAVLGMTVGGTVPMLMGIDNGFGLWSILGGFVGGIAGIWLGVKLVNRYG